MCVPTSTSRQFVFRSGARPSLNARQGPASCHAADCPRAMSPFRRYGSTIRLRTAKRTSSLTE
jgi:hypothetical protein